MTTATAHRHTARHAIARSIVVFDVDVAGLAHTRIDCPEHLGLIELVETSLGHPCDDPEVVEYVADLHGLVSEAHLVHQARPCHHCTLVAAPYWLAAA